MSKNFHTIKIMPTENRDDDYSRLDSSPTPPHRLPGAQWVLIVLGALLGLAILWYLIYKLWRWYQNRNSSQTIQKDSEKTIVSLEQAKPEIDSKSDYHYNSTA